MLKKICVLDCISSESLKCSYVLSLRWYNMRNQHLTERNQTTQTGMTIRNQDLEYICPASLSGVSRSLLEGWKHQDGRCLQGPKIIPLSVSQGATVLNDDEMSLYNSSVVDNESINE